MLLQLVCAVYAYEEDAIKIHDVKKINSRRDGVYEANGSHEEKDNKSCLSVFLISEVLFFIPCFQSFYQKGQANCI